MKQIYLLLFAIAFSFSAVAQINFKPGYVIAKDSSRTEGLIDYRGTTSNAALQVTFKTNNAAQPIVYQPSEILGYGLADSKQYESTIVTGANNTSQTYFMEVLAKGAATLYFMKSEKQAERFFVTSPDGQPRELIQETRRVDNGSGKIYNATLKHYVGTLTSVLNACLEVEPLINKARFEQSDLVRIVNKYNVCVAPEQVKVARSENEMKPTVEKMVIIGGTLTNVTIKSDSYADRYVTQGDVKPAIAATAGIAFNITASKISQNLSLYTGLMYQYYKMEGDYRKDYDGGSYDAFEFNLEASHLKLPILLRYTWPKGKVRPYLNAGAQGAVLLKADSKVVEMHGNTYGDNIRHEREMMPAYRKTELGFIGGIGIKTAAFGNRTITLEARQERNNGLSAGIGFKQTNHITSVLLGVSF
ncbi:porin family protein [Pontibacter sp. H259]|uniref:porin family protein n=1 Tax=Pontibacter sp. H259 TaxID=3133421 RepID=UPI0030C18EB6